jgi:sulfite exporter TauE/SafE
VVLVLHSLCPNRNAGDATLDLVTKEEHPVIETLAAAWLVGLLGGVHCAGMCGGIVSALTLGLPAQGPLAQLPFQLSYNAGRVISYSLAGALMGGLGMMLTKITGLETLQNVLLALSGIFMILLGFYLAGWWRVLTLLEQVGQHLWQRLEPFGRHLLPVRRPGQALLLGLLWGWLPCGLVYSALIWSLSAGGPWQGALLMLAFGLGTLPNLLLMGAAASQLQAFIRLDAVRIGAALLVMAFGLVALWRVWTG